MNWLFLTLLSVFAVSLANILQRVLMKDDKSNPYSYAIVFQFLIAILNLPIAVWHGFQLSILTGDLIFFCSSGCFMGRS